MGLPLHLLIPLLCAFIYVLGALTMKRAAELGVGVWRTSFVANWTLVLVFVPLAWWIGAALSTGAIALLHAGERHGAGRNVGLTVILASLSAASYSLSDVLIQKWAPAWGGGSYLPPMFLLMALYSFVLVPFFHAPLRAMPAQAWRWVGLGALLMGVNNAGIIITVGMWGQATAVNIVYSVRGLLSVVLVWVIGHWFASGEQHLDPRVFRYRLAGAALMVAAIVLVLA